MSVRKMPQMTGRKMKNWMIATCIGVMALAGWSGSLSAQTALKDVERIREGIIATGIAYEISEQCSSISPRYLRGIGFLNSLKSHARDLGYSEAQIESYIDDSKEKKRLEAIARERLEALGAVAGSQTSYCAVGRAQIEAGSDIGRLLR